KACVLPENPASYRVVRTKSYLFNKAVAEIKETFTAGTQQIFNAERQAGNYRFLSSHYDIWFISEFMTAIGF
ncbi:hypothetical protein, partial [Enterobacter roggenkampii]|uniref:hypothetical protein n=1 Tax=Enterobacter roggenkampii TaxID=1812935 RepID=UPI002FF7234A